MEKTNQLLRDIDKHMRAEWYAGRLSAESWPKSLSDRLAAALLDTGGQAQAVPDDIRAALSAAVEQIEHDALKIEMEWGMGRNLYGMEIDGDLPPALLQARAALATTTTAAAPVLPEPDFLQRHEDVCGDEVGPPTAFYTADTVRALLATGGQAYPCWSCNAAVTKKQRSDADGNCPHCNAELDLEDWPRAMATGGQGQAVANPAIDFPHEEFDAIAATRYKVVAADQSMFWGWAVVAGDGTQQLYVGRKVDCENMARKFAGAFADGSFHAMHAAPQQADARDAAFEAVRKKFCKLQRYSFFLDDKGNVRRVPQFTGNWVEFESVHTLFDPASVDAAIAAAKGE